MKRLPYTSTLSALLLLGLLAFTPRADAAYYNPVIAPSHAKASIVLVEAAEYGTAFTIAHRGRSTYFITAAHLIDKDAYDLNAKLPSSVFKKKPSDWLTIYDPFDGQPYPGEIIGDPDFANDILVFRVAEMLHKPRPLCLAKSLPIFPPFSLASFHLEVLQAPPSGAFLQYGYPVELTGDASPLADGNEFQYSGFLEQGFSGSPIFDRESGAVIGIVRRSPYSQDPTTLKMVVSPNTRYGVTVDAIRRHLAKLAGADPNLRQLSVIDEDDRTTLIPRLTGTLRLIAFDFPRSGNGLAPEYQPYEQEIRKLIAQRFRHINGSADIEVPTDVFALGTRTTSLGDICLLRNGEHAAGVVGLRREMSTGPARRVLEARVALIGCDGRIIDAAGLTATPVSTSKPDPAQVAAFTRNLSGGLDALSAGNGFQRLMNFAGDGLPLADAEQRGFYRVHRDGASTLIAYSWFGGVSADVPDLADERAVVSIDGLNSADLQNLTSAGLDAFLERAGRDVPAVIAAPDGSTHKIALSVGDRCVYLERKAKSAVATPRDKDTVL